MPYCLNCVGNGLYWPNWQEWGYFLLSSVQYHIIPIMHIEIMVSGRYCHTSYSYMVFGLGVYLYVYMWTCFFSYLSNHVNHLFITIQKIIQMAISFKINIVVYVYTFIIASLLFIVLVLLF